MDLTLRQARGLESRLRNLSIDNQTISIRAYDSEVARLDIENGVKALDTEIDIKLDLNDIRHRIKKDINIRNMECGVAELLNTRDMLYAKRDILNTLGASDSVDRQVEHIKSSPKAQRTVSVYTQDLEEGITLDLADIDIQLNDISKQLNELNNSITISLSEEDVDSLKEGNLL